ncbi:MAG: hypothetical protein ACREV4_00360 [Gammaproteobacteria bacterium]
MQREKFNALILMGGWCGIRTPFGLVGDPHGIAKGIFPVLGCQHLNPRRRSLFERTIVDPKNVGAVGSEWNVATYGTRYRRRSCAVFLPPGGCSDYKHITAIVQVLKATPSISRWPSSVMTAI